jgi:serine/threonine protein kinase
LSLDRVVAVKVLNSDPDDADLVYFEREQRAMGRVSGHPNVVPVLHSGLTFAGRPYIVMQYHRRDTLGAWIRGHGPLGVRDAVGGAGWLTQRVAAFAAEFGADVEAVADSGRITIRSVPRKHLIHRHLRPVWMCIGGTGGTMVGEKTVHDVTHDLVRSPGLTTVFGNPGSIARTRPR